MIASHVARSSLRERHRRRRARVVHQDLDLAVALAKVAERRRDLRGVGDVRDDDVRLRALGQRRRVPRQHVAVAPEQRHARAVRGERGRDRRADSAPAAGHQRVLAGQTTAHRVTSLAASAAICAARRRLRRYCSRPVRYCSGQCCSS